MTSKDNLKGLVLAGGKSAVSVIGFDDVPIIGFGSLGQRGDAAKHQDKYAGQGEENFMMTEGDHGVIGCLGYELLNINKNYRFAIGCRMRSSRIRSSL